MTTHTTYERRETAPPPSPATEARNTGVLLRDLTREASTLFRQEIALAKTEMMEKARVAVRNTVYIAAGGSVAWAGFLVLLLAASAGLFVALANVMAWYHALWVGPLIVGAVVTIIGLAVLVKGKNTLKQQNMVPEKTVETMRENKQWLKNEIT